MTGGTVCRMHGGSAPQVRNAARLRLLAASDPAAAELVKQIKLKGSKPWHVANRRAAALAILDRA